MKKTLNINLGGIAFIIDENAFDILFNYLEALKKKFDNEAERQEILNDIEARIAEMFTEKLGSRKEVIGVEEVTYVIAQMGQPEAIAGEEPAEENTQQQATSGQSTAGSYTRETIHKRLYRDPDDAKVGGVIAGLCHYFGIQDPVWVRIAAIILIPITSGSIIFLYLLLLIIIPKATTAAEKLQMKGEPININTIEKEVKEAASKFSASVKVTMDAEGFFRKLWGLVALIGGMVLRLLAVLLILASLGALVGVLVGFFVFFILGTTPFNSLTHLLVSQPSLISVASIGMLLFLGAPLLALIYLGLRILVGHGSRLRWLKWVLLTAWIVGLGMLLFAGVHTGLDFANEAVKKDNVYLMQPAGGHLLVQVADSTDAGWVTEKDETQEDEEDDHFGIIINGKNWDEIQSIKIGKPDLELIPSDNDSLYLQKVVRSHGRNHTDALHNIETVMYAFLQTDTVLNLSRHFEIPKKGGRYRAQDMKIRIAIPEGSRVSFGSNIDDLSVTVKDNSDYDDTYFANTTWTVESGQVKCLNCEKSKEEKTKTEEQAAPKDSSKAQQQIKEKQQPDQEQLKQAENKLENRSPDHSHQDF